MALLMRPRYCHVLLPLLVLSALAAAGVAADAGGRGEGAGVERTYIVRVDADAKPSVYPTHAHWYEAAVLSAASAGDGGGGAGGWPEGGPLIHTYAAAFHGFSARMTPAAAAALSSSPGVAAVLPERVRRLATTRSPRFLGLLSSPPSALLADSDFGADLVVAVVDTGISPAHRSFHDRGLGPVPARWRGVCASGPGFPSSSCNRKLVGARFFSKGYEATSGRMNETAEVRSPLDTDGHGTHTASIAAGRYVFPASTLGYARGVAAGMAPKARLAAYKVCWVGGCFDSDILAAFDAAVADGVDVVSLSVGGVVVPYYLDAIAIGAFGATEAGIVVSASAGNGGPGGLTVTNVAPWMATVGAGSMDRAFPANVRLGDGQVLDGVSVYGGPALEPGKMYELVYAGASTGGGGGGGASSAADGYSASMCLDGSLDPAAVRGKIVVCDRGVNSRAAKGDVARRTGAVGMVLANGAFDGEGLVADCHVLPATAVGAAAGQRLRKYIASSTKQRPATGTIVFEGTHLGVHPAPVVAAFSARGPNPQSPEILKPDLIAPGLNILAAWPSGVGPAGIPSDTRRTEFNILSGTSMACPHVSGLAALLKAAHPTWSPAAIKSALMTTAYVRDNSNGTMVDESTGAVAGAFDFGAGHVDPMRAMDPGLVYDIASGDYVNFLCNLNYTEQNIRAITRRQADCRGARRAGHAGNLNYPSLSATFVAGGRAAATRTHFIRTATNVGGGRAVYRASVSAPEGCNVTVQPRQLAFRRDGQRLSFTVRVEAAAAAPGKRMEPGSSVVRSGALTWSDGRHVVRSPIVVTVQAPLQ
ncbi:Subtilisin-like protease SBT1.5 [Dichanthelium oligosanthes]|uniref:Subtilisin-like protease SBT1.5 n=1 Tax=Dichanthelium oligosanthes TaxID=888268 RepID=A0A1E5VUF9_9POAL|nr:Subtilisin-like protease SBT1.5 [Dichanthelium oligosanthes]